MAEERSSGRLPFPGAFAFVGSGSLLVLEIVAGRILAPDVGVSLYTWTSVIGVVLAGLSLGNWLGGKIADRWPGRSMLSLLYLLAAFCSALILLFARDLHAVDAPASWTAILQVLWLTTLVFFLPSVLLGTPTPMLVKLSLDSLDATGRVVGRIQAAATLGSIVGVFATGFLLISAFGTRPVVAGVAVALLLLAFLSHPLASSPRSLAAAAGRRPHLAALVAGVVVAIVAFTAASKDECTRESNYFCIRVATNSEGLRELRLDLLIHSLYSPSQPDKLFYDYEKLYEQITKAAFDRHDRMTTFTIGGGAYSFPRYLDRFYPSHNVVAEIDPEVTDVARDYFGLKDSPGIEIIHNDARLVLRDRPKSERYDLVLGDAFNDIAVPYHLTTREFNELVASHLSPRGLYLTNVIDGIDYDFLRSYLKTLRKTFPYVGLATVPGQPLEGERATVVVVSSFRPLPAVRNLYSYDLIKPFIEGGETVTLTDDHVPVDQLLAPVYGDSLEEAH